MFISSIKGYRFLRSYYLILKSTYGNQECGLKVIDMTSFLLDSLINFTRLYFLCDDGICVHMQIYVS